MEQYLEFFGNHTGLSAAFFGLVGVFVWTLTQGAGRGVKKAGPMDVARLINHEDALVLDVRSDGEFNTGHILNAMHIPQQHLDEQLDKLAKYHDRPIITVCRSGQTSARAGSTLHKKGFENIYYLNGGLLAWEDAQLPLSKK